MKRYILLLLIALTPFVAQAQMSIDRPTEKSEIIKSVAFRDSVKMQSISHDYFSPALYRYERKQIRLERNTLEVTGGVSGSLTNLSDSWIETSGGDNTISILATVYLKHIFKKGDFSLENIVSAKFGYYRMVLEETLDDNSIQRDPVWYKNQDEILLSVTPSYKMSQNWSYGVNFKFRTQLSKGYVSSASQESFNLKSDFLSPGYFDISGGLIYTCPDKKYPFTVTLSPVAMSAVYVKSAEVRENAQYAYADPESTTEAYTEVYGVNPTLTSKYEGGSSIQIDYDKSFGKDGYLRYTTSVYSFYGWMAQITAKNVYSDIKEYEVATTEWSSSQEGVAPVLTIHPTVRWENKVTIQASKLISTTLSLQLYYNRAQNYNVQTQTLLSVGLSYNFKNK